MPTPRKNNNHQKESVIARRNIRRDVKGERALPRLSERPAYPGDIHPIPKSVLIRLLKHIPDVYLYGLSRIELRARGSMRVGDPFGVYLRDENAIALYSLPTVWELDLMGSMLTASVTKFHAIIKKKPGKVSVEWPKEEFMSLWFYGYVFAHELGHHYRNKYRYKRKRGGFIEEELVADLHAKRLTDMLFAALQKRRAERLAGRDAENRAR